MEKFVWSDQLGPRSRKAWLLFVLGDGDEVLPFNGETIPGVVVVQDNIYEKEGKWSKTIFTLRVAEGVRPIAGRDGWDTGRFAEGIATAVGTAIPTTWPELSEALGVSVPSAMEFLRAWRPGAATRLDKVESELAELEEASAASSAEDTAMVTVSFGSPTNREIRDGYWESPKPIPGYDGAEIRLLDPEAGWSEGNLEVVGITGSVLSVRHSAGTRGGYYAVTVAVLPGTEVPVPPFETRLER